MILYKRVVIFYIGVRPAECFDCCWVAGLYRSWPTPEESYVFLMRTRPGPFYPAAGFGIATATCWCFRVCPWDGQRSEQRFYFYLRWDTLPNGYSGPHLCFIFCACDTTRVVVLSDFQETCWFLMLMAGAPSFVRGGHCNENRPLTLYYDFHAAVLYIAYYLFIDLIII